LSVNARNGKGRRKVLPIVWQALLFTALLFGAPARALVEDRTEVDEALRAARKSGKPVLVAFSTTACGYCKRMRRETLADASVSAELEGFEHAAVDLGRDPVSARIYGIPGVPAFVVLSPEGREVSRLVGFAGAEAFRDWLWRANEAFGLGPAGKQDFEVFAEEVRQKLAQEDKLEVGKGIGLLLGRTRWRDPLYREFATLQLLELAEERPELLVPWLKAPKLVMRIHVYNALLGKVRGLEDADPWEPPRK